MIQTIKGTTSAGIQSAISEIRQTLGAASGMVFTLLVMPQPHELDDVMDACLEAGREHPSRIIVATDGSSRSDRMDAEIQVGEGLPGEVITLKFHGEVAQHKASALLPLLLPDSPVIAWWPGASPAHPSQDAVGALASRRITDAMGADDPLAALVERAACLAPGDTDLTWTRLTPWRALLASALDQPRGTVESASVHAGTGNAAGLLLAAWLRSRLGTEVTFMPNAGPGITEVTLTTDEGEIQVARTDGKMATFAAPGSPTLAVALRRRDIAALITEELRVLEADHVFAASMAELAADESLAELTQGA